MKIGIVPKVIEKYKNQFEYSVELKLINFLKKCFKKSEVYVLNEKKKVNLDLLIFSGGNDIYQLSKKKKDNIREKIDTYYFRNQKGKVPIIGICYGAQFLAKRFIKKFKKSNKHTRSHNLYFSSLINKKKIKVFSHHNYVIDDLRKLKIFARAGDGTIEGFYKFKTFFGLIWHPERQNKIDTQIKIFKKIYETLNSSIRKR